MINTHFLHFVCTAAVLTPIFLLRRLDRASGMNSRHCEQTYVVGPKWWRGEKVWKVDQSLMCARREGHIPRQTDRHSSQMCRKICHPDRPAWSMLTLSAKARRTPIVACMQPSRRAVGLGNPFFTGTSGTSIHGSALVQKSKSLINMLFERSSWKDKASPHRVVKRCNMPKVTSNTVIRSCIEFHGYFSGNGNGGRNSLFRLSKRFSNLERSP